MTCSTVQASLSLYLYGELDFAAEEALELHLGDCALCQLALNREKEWHAAVNLQQQDVRPEWLAGCRRNLYHRIAEEPTTAAQWAHRLQDGLRGFFDFRFTERSYRLAGVSFLLMLGFIAGRMWHSFAVVSAQNGPGDAAGLLEAPVTHVQQIQPESGNRVRLVLQRVQVREISGNRNDEGVRELLLGARRESSDPGVRMDSVEMLAGQSGQAIRNAIVDTVKNDPNAAVRLKAVETLRQFPNDPLVQEALEYALAHDQDAGVRTEAMDVLVPAGGNVQVTPQLLQTITDVLGSSQDDDYLRLRCAQILHSRSDPNGVY
jgi:hypothetical protein